MRWCDNLTQVLVNEHYEKHVEQLIKVAARFATALSDGGIDYRIVGGLAVYLHVNAIDPIAARLTRDIDTAVRRIDVEKISHILNRLASIIDVLQV